MTGPAGLTEWHPRDLVTLIDLIEEADAARRRANRG